MDPIIIGIIVAFVILGGFALIGIGLMRMPTASDEVAARLDQYAVADTGHGGADSLELRGSFADRNLKPTLQGLSRIIAKRMPAAALAQMRADLEAAGHPGNMRLPEFLGLKVAMSLGLAVLATVILLLAPIDFAFALLGFPIFLILGFYLPNFWLKRRIKKRQKAIQLALPDVLDLLCISVQAGLGFDAAMQKVVDKWSNPLTYEFSRVIAEMRVGKARREALHDMALRCKVQDLSTFIAAIVQADQLGVSISNLLVIQAKQMRTRRRQRAEKLAHEAPIKMLFPMALCMLPTIFIVIMGPLVPRLVEMFGNG